MKSTLASGAASISLHAGLVGAFVALSVCGPASLDPVDLGIQCVRESGMPEMKVTPPRPDAEIEFEPVEFRVELEHPMPRETVEERPPTLFDVADARPVPRPDPPEPPLDRPIRPTVQRIAPAPSATETVPSEISNPPPEYPPLARRRGYEGSLVLAFEVLPDGTCGDVRVAQTSGHDILDEAAVRAVRGWRFRAATKNGQPVAATQHIRFTFKLQG